MIDTKLEDDIDYQFILRVQAEVTQSCALPIAIPIERIPEYIVQAAQWFWQNDDFSSEERMYIIKNSDICKDTHGLNKIIQLPNQIIAVTNVFKTRQNSNIGHMGDFSLERMMVSSYGMFTAGSGIGNVGMSGNPTGWSLTDVIGAMYEISTFEQAMNAPLSYNFNTYSKKLVLLGDLGHSDILMKCYIRCRIQDLYNNYYFFRKVVALCKRALHTIYGMYEFKLPGGITINYSLFQDAADKDEEEIKEYVENNRCIDFILQPNTI